MHKSIFYCNLMVLINTRNTNTNQYYFLQSETFVLTKYTMQNKMKAKLKYKTFKLQ